MWWVDEHGEWYDPKAFYDYHQGDSSIEPWDEWDGGQGELWDETEWWEENDENEWWQWYFHQFGDSDWFCDGAVYDESAPVEAPVIKDPNTKFNG